MTTIRQVTYEYIGTDSEVDRFLESAIRDYYGTRLQDAANTAPTLIDKVEVEGVV